MKLEDYLKANCLVRDISFLRTVERIVSKEDISLKDLINQIEYYNNDRMDKYNCELMGSIKSSFYKFLTDMLATKQKELEQL